MKPIISASILNADFTCLKQQIAESENAGISWIHLDVMDGHFVPNITIGPFVVEACKKVTNLPLDVHLMIENPEQFVERFAQAGSNYLSVHIENNPHINRLLNNIRELGCKPGIVLNPGTPANSISSILHLVDLILVMTVNPGFGGQTFLFDQLEKIKQVKQMTRNLPASPLIQVDGGITAQTLPLAAEAGADVFVVGSAIFTNPAGIKKGVSDLISSLK